MRRAARVDDNQAAIVEALRAAGCSVLSIASIGAGAPDLAVGRGGKTYFLEVKDGGKPPSARRLTADELKFHGSWVGHITVVKSVAEALAAVGA